MFSNCNGCSFPAATATQNIKPLETCQLHFRNFPVYQECYLNLGDSRTVNLSGGVLYRKDFTSLLSGLGPQGVSGLSSILHFVITSGWAHAANSPLGLGAEGPAQKSMGSVGGAVRREQDRGLLYKGDHCDLTPEAGGCLQGVMQAGTCCQGPEWRGLPKGPGEAPLRTRNGYLLPPRKNKPNAE